MKLLLDTHVFLWMDGEPARLSAHAAQLLSDRSNSLHLSVVSLWEIQIKLQRGKLHLRLPLEQIVREQQVRNGLGVMPINIDHVYRVGHLGRLHNDPFDRMIAAVALHEGAVLLSADPIFR
jgi:PIN domain nuclease of toxin-antitoxin system